MRRLIVAVYAALLFALFAVPKADAQNCRTAYGYSAPVYHQQYVAPVAYDYNRIIVPKAFQVEVATPFYMGVSDDYRQLNFAKQVAEEYAKIVEFQRQHLSLGNGNVSAPNTLPLTTAKPTTKIGTILANRCVSCHTPGKNTPDLSGNPDAISEVVRLKCLQQLTLGKMPKGKPPLPQDEFNEFGAWTEAKPSEFSPGVPAIPPAKKDPEPKKEVLTEPKDKK